MEELHRRLIEGVTAKAVASHLKKRGWKQTGKLAGRAELAEHGQMDLYEREREDGTVDHTAVPVDHRLPHHAERLAAVLAASAARDGLDLADVAAELKL